MSVFFLGKADTEFLEACFRIKIKNKKSHIYEIENDTVRFKFVIGRHTVAVLEKLAIRNRVIL